LNILIVSCLGESCGLAIRLLGEGHQVKMYIHETEAKDCSDGFVDKVDNWREWIEWADMVIWDDCDQKVEGETAYKSSAWSQEVRQSYPGKLVIGGGAPEVSELENDRIFGQAMLQQYDVHTVPMERFTSFDAARNFVEENPGAYALKHNNQVDRKASGVFDTPEEAIEFINYLEKNWNELGGGKPVDFVLQEKAKGDNPVELAVTCFYDGTKFRSEACYVNQEIKRLMDGDIGPLTGQMGEIGVILNNPRIFQETLAKCEPWFANKGYIGFIDLNCILTGPNPENIVPLEFTARPGYPTLFSFLECLDEPVGEWLARMAAQDPTPIQAQPKVNCTIILATGTFPYPDPSNKMSVLNGLNEVGLRHVWLCEAQWDNEAEKVVGAGDLGYMAVITSTGQNIPQACQSAYKIIEQLTVQPHSIHRWDIGQKAVQEFPIVAQEGWI
jgi:phosphoribosylamine--glycine ligase